MWKVEMLIYFLRNVVFFTKNVAFGVAFYDSY